MTLTHIQADVGLELLSGVAHLFSNIVPLVPAMVCAIRCATEESDRESSVYVVRKRCLRLTSGPRWDHSGHSGACNSKENHDAG
jgi:hypothetical protein